MKTVKETREMSEYDYIEVLKDDIAKYVNENMDELKGLSKDEVYDKLNDDLWIEDSVTGNGSGTYTFSRDDAKEHVLAQDEEGNDNLDIVRDMIAQGELTKDKFADYIIDNDWESIDVCIRCHLLGEAIWSVMDKMDFAEESA